MEVVVFFFFQAEDGIRDLVRSRGLGDVYKRQVREQSLEINGALVDARAAVGASNPDANFVDAILGLSLIHI